MDNNRAQFELLVGMFDPSKKISLNWDRSEGRYSQYETRVFYDLWKESLKTIRSTLDDYRDNGFYAVRFAPSSALWSNELLRLFGPEARDGINALESQIRENKTTRVKQVTCKLVVNVSIQ